MKAKLDTTKQNHTWVIKMKYKVDGIVELHNTQLVVKGFTQHVELGFLDTFSLVATLVSVKSLLSLVAILSMGHGSIVCHNMFLNGDLIEEVCMDLPLSHPCRKGEHLPQNLVCRMKKSIMV